MINLQRLTGARPGEVIQIRPCDIERLEEVWIFRPARHKTKYRGRDREIYLGPQAQAALEPFMDRPAESFCFSPIEAEAERNAERSKQRKTPMTPSQAARKPKAKSKRAKRGRYDVPSYRRAINYGIKRADVPAWHPNQLRHSCATRTHRSFGIDAAQVILGHKKCDVTQVYADIDREKAIRIVAENG